MFRTMTAADNACYLMNKACSYQLSRYCFQIKCIFSRLRNAQHRIPTYYLFYTDVYAFITIFRKRASISIEFRFSRRVSFSSEKITAIIAEVREGPTSKLAAVMIFLGQSSSLQSFSALHFIYCNDYMLYRALLYQDFYLFTVFL